MDGHCQTASFPRSIQKGLPECSHALTGQGLLFCFVVLLDFFFCLFELPLFHTRWQSSVFCLRTELVNISHTALQARMKLSVLFQPIDFCQTHSHTLLLCSDCSSLLFLRLLFFFFDSKLDIWLLTVSSIKDKKYVSEKY